MNKCSPDPRKALGEAPEGLKCDLLKRCSCASMGLAAFQPASGVREQDRCDTNFLVVFGSQLQ